MGEVETWEVGGAACPDNHRRLASRSAGDALYGDLHDFALTASPHQPIASERKLARQYGISVATVRRTLDRLVKERLVYKRERMGNFVADGPARAKAGRGGLKTLIYADCWGPDPRPMTARLMHGLASQAAAEGIRLQVLHTPPDGDAFCDDEHVLRALSEPDVVAAAVPWIHPPWLRKVRRLRPHLKLIATFSKAAGIDSHCGSVIPDYYGLGWRGAQQLAAGGARRIHCVYEEFHAYAGAMEVADESEKLEIVGVPHDRADPKSLVEVSKRLRSESVEAILFSDDRLAARAIEDLQAADPEVLQRIRIASHANTGENLLPAEVIRLEFDFYEVGRATVLAAVNMIRHDGLGPSEVLIPPRLILPSMEAARDDEASRTIQETATINARGG